MGTVPAVLITPASEVSVFKNGRNRPHCFEKESVMGKIVVLDEITAGKIAAGEVVERPASIVKELVENSIDAQATSIVIEIKNGGKTYIRVTDNGTGIREDDVELAFERYSTSKIKRADDLESIRSLGFRGEALASIAAVSNVELVTRTSDCEHGVKLILSAAALVEKNQIGAPIGTTITIKNLFFNTPARYKFMGKDSVEAAAISDVLARMALCTPNVAFRFINNGNEVLRTPGNGDLKSCIYSIYGANVLDSLIEIMYSDNVINVSGYISNTSIAYSNRNFQTIVLNSRYIKSKTVSSAISLAYKTLLPQAKFAFAVLNIKTNPSFVDVNVHPAKMEVKFSDEQLVFNAIYNAVVRAIHNRELFSFSSKAQKPYSEKNSPEDTQAYEQVPIINKTQLGEKLTDTKQHYQMSEDVSTAEIARNNFTEAENNNIELELDKQNEVSHNDVRHNLDYRIIGQAFSTYIFIEIGDAIYVIDQHAAHERIMYERLIKAQADLENTSQMLAVPEVMNVTPQELEYVKEYTKEFSELGFNYEIFGGNSIILRSMPYILSDLNVAEIFREIINLYIDGAKSKDLNQCKDSALYQMACKAAVKANKKLSDIEIENLLDDLLSAKGRFTCPHGRPTVIKMSKYELEKRFLRT